MSTKSNHAMPFGDVLDRIHEMPIEDQEELVNIVRRRLIERRRERLIAECREGEREFQEGRTTSKPPEEVMKDILS